MTLPHSLVAFSLLLGLCSVSSGQEYAIPSSFHDAFGEIPNAPTAFAAPVPSVNSPYASTPAPTATLPVAQPQQSLLLQQHHQQLNQQYDQRPFGTTLPTSSVAADETAIEYAADQAMGHANGESSLAAPNCEYTLADLEALATQNHPALREAAEYIEAARGRSWQAGLPPNPTVGYVGNEIGNDGSPGQHGAYISRQWVRGGKLQLSRAVECRDIDRLRQEYEVTRHRILTDIRTSYTGLVWLQMRMELLVRFRETNQNVLRIASQLFAAGENTSADVLRAEIELARTSTDLASLDATHAAKWKALERLAGNMSLPPMKLKPDGVATPDFSWEEALQMMQQSPQLAAIQAEIHRNQAALRRARAQPIPDLNTQFSLQYDVATNHTFAGVQMGMAVPKRNRNQGGIYAASAEIRAAMQKLERVRLLLERRLADKYGEFRSAHLQVARIKTEIVPKAEQLVKIAVRAYQQGEVGMINVLTAQSSMLRSTLQLQEAQKQLQSVYVEMQGFLLDDALGSEF